MIEKYGYTALKMGIQAPGDMPYNRATRETAAHVRAVREAVGPDVDIGVDVHAKFFEAERAIRLAKAIEPYNPMWMEESVRPENYDAMKKVADHVNIPLASGESNYGIYEFKQLIERQALDFVQPDICCCGGVLTMKKIAAMAEAQYIMVAPHNPMSPLATAVNVHFAASTPNFYILEYARAGFGRAQERAERAADGQERRLSGHPEQAGLGRGAERRGLQAACLRRRGAAARTSARTARRTSSKRSTAVSPGAQNSKSAMVSAPLASSAWKDRT